MCPAICGFAGAKRQKVASKSRLFRGATGLPSSMQKDNYNALPESEREQETFDPVVDERKRWEKLSPDEYERFYRPDGLLNEFQMMWQLRAQFPTHLLVFTLNP